MLKKHLLVSAIALGVSSIALANGSHMAAPAVAAAPAAVSDYTPSMYVGLQGGMVDSGLKAAEGGEFFGHMTDSVSNKYGFAGRTFVGYDINKYFAVEAGYMYDFQKAELKSVDGSEKVRFQAVDLVGKVKAPIMDNFGLYAKLGPGYLMVHPDDFSNRDKFDVVYGVGAYYTFAANWNVDLSWTRYNSGETKIGDNKWQPSVDFYALGVSYKFDLPV